MIKAPFESMLALGYSIKIRLFLNYSKCLIHWLLILKIVTIRITVWRIISLTDFVINELETWCRNWVLVSVKMTEQLIFLQIVRMRNIETHATSLSIASISTILQCLRSFHHRPPIYCMDIWKNCKLTMKKKHFKNTIGRKCE